MTPMQTRLIALGLLVVAGGALVFAGTPVWRGDAIETASVETGPNAPRHLQWTDLLPEGGSTFVPLDAASDFPAVTGMERRYVPAGDPSQPGFQIGGIGGPGGPAMSETTLGDLAAERTGPPATPVPQPANAARADLKGERVAISGYMTPLLIEAGETRTFLLVPYVGACIHVPAPPPNQIVLVETKEPVKVRQMWEPFTAVGTLGVEQIDTGLAEVGYTMALERIDPYRDGTAPSPVQPHQVEPTDSGALDAIDAAMTNARTDG